MTRGPGRPRLAEDVATIYVRVPRATHDRLLAAAGSRGQTLAEWVRDVLERSARRVLR